MKTYKTRGISIVEVIIASAIILFVTSVVFSSYTLTSRISLQNTAFLQAAFLAEEGIEAVRVVRDFGFTNNIAPLSLDTEYYLFWNGVTWVATTTYSLIDQKFERTFILGAVSRDSNFNIVSSGGTVDPESRKVTVSISWDNGGVSTTKSIEGYIFNTFNN